MVCPSVKQARRRPPQQILASATRLLDFGRPVAVMPDLDEAPTKLL
jgi:hypothetical protein